MHSPDAFFEKNMLMRLSFFLVSENYLSQNLIRKS